MRFSVRAALFLTFLSVAWQVQAAPEQVNHFEHSTCAFNFDEPNGWASKEVPGCEVLVEEQRSKAVKADEPLGSISVRKGSGTFLAVAEELGFDWRDGKWIMYGRQDQIEEVESFKTARGYSGIRGTAATVCRSDDVLEGEKFTCWLARVALVASNGDTVAIEGTDSEALDKIVETFSFDR